MQNRLFQYATKGAPGAYGGVNPTKAPAYGKNPNIDYSSPNAGNNWWGHGSHDAWMSEHVKTLPSGARAPGGCSGGCGGGGGAGNPQMAALQKQLDAQLATLQSGELAFQKYLDQAEKDRAVTIQAQKKIDDEMKKQQDEAEAVTKERKTRMERGKRDLIRYVDEEDEASNMLALGGQL